MILLNSLPQRAQRAVRAEPLYSFKADDFPIITELPQRVFHLLFRSANITGLHNNQGMHSETVFQHGYFSFHEQTSSGILTQSVWMTPGADRMNEQSCAEHLMTSQMYWTSNTGLGRACSHFPGESSFQRGLLGKIKHKLGSFAEHSVHQGLPVCPCASLLTSLPLRTFLSLASSTARVRPPTN